MIQYAAASAVQSLTPVEYWIARFRGDDD